MPPQLPRLPPAEPLYAAVRCLKPDLVQGPSGAVADVLRTPSQTGNPLSPSKMAIARVEKARLRDLKKKQEEELERVRDMQNRAVGTDGVRF